MRWALSVLLAVLLIGLLSRRSESALILGWVDEFLAGHMECYRPNGGNPACGAASNFDTVHWAGVWGTNAPTAPSWAYLGQQGANATGRANARGKVMFRFNITNLSSGAFQQITTSYDRFRRSTIPPLGAACGSGGGETYIGTVNQTFDSFYAGASGNQINNRLLPVFDFRAETGIGDIAYREVIRGTDSAHNPIPANSGCYKIRWF